MAIHADVLKTLSPENLSEVAPRVRDGDILLCSTRGMFAHLIRWSTKSPWSHVAIVYRSPIDNRLCVFECVQRSGVRMLPLERFIQQGSNGKRPFPGKVILARHADVVEVGETKPLVDFATDCLGDSFSPTEIAKIAVRITLGRINKQMPKTFAKNNKFICSEYVAECFKKVGITIQWDGLGFIAPVDVALDPKVHAVAQLDTRQISAR